MAFNCEISFVGNPYGVYFSGSNLNGCVIITTSKMKKVRGIYLQISGVAQCHWSETHTTGSGKNRRSHTVSYDGRQDYLDSTTYLLGSVNGDSVEIPIGKTTHNFACALPATLPSSFEGGYGHIRYTVKVVFDRPWKFDQTFKVAFTVLKQFDLNYDPTLRIASKLDKIKTFCCWPCESGPLVMSAQIPQTGYVPGQKIPILVNISNGSNIDVYEVDFILKKMIYYNSQYPPKTKIEPVDLIQVCSAGVKAGSKGTVENELTVPPVPPTNVTSCTVIHVLFELCIEFRVSGAHINPKLNIPITIGTIPINMNQPLQYPQIINQQPYPGGIQVVNIGFNDPPLSSNAAAPLLPNAPVAPKMDDFAPPSYEQCFGGTKEIKDANEDKNGVSGPFAPRYPVYNFSNATAPPNN